MTTDLDIKPLLEEGKKKIKNLKISKVENILLAGFYSLMLVESLDNSSCTEEEIRQTKDMYAYTIRTMVDHSIAQLN